jgi:hypothetical protein
MSTTVVDPDCAAPEEASASANGKFMIPLPKIVDCF